MLPHRCGALPGGLFVKQISFLTVSGSSFFSHYMIENKANDFRGTSYFNCTRQVKMGGPILTVPDRSKQGPVTKAVLAVTGFSGGPTISHQYGAHVASRYSGLAPYNI